MNVPINNYLFLAGFLFALGVFVLLTKRNTILMLLGIELIFTASIINFVVFGELNKNMDGNIFTLFIILIAVCESAVSLAIILNVYRHFNTMVPDKYNELKG